MILPTIHLNGTSPAMLLEGYMLAYYAAHSAADTLAAVEFNARDYYVAGPEAWTAARNEHQARVSALLSVADQLMKICEHCQEAIDAREELRRERAIAVARSTPTGGAS